PPLFCFHGDRRRGARSKHNALWKTCGAGDPPAAPAPGRAPRGPGAAQAACRFARAPRARPDAQHPLGRDPPRPRGSGAPRGQGAQPPPRGPGREPSPTSGAASGAGGGRPPPKPAAPPRPAPPRFAPPRPASPRLASPRLASPAASPRPAPRAARGAGLGGGAARGAGGSAAGGGASGTEGGQDGGAHGAVLLVGGLGAAVSGPGQSGRADLCQIYWCPTQGVQDHQPLAEPFRDSACPSDQSRRGHLGATQDHHPSSKRGSGSRGHVGTNLTQDVQRGLLRCGRLRHGARVQRAVVAPGPWNETEQIAKTWALREPARGPWFLRPGLRPTLHLSSTAPALWCPDWEVPVRKLPSAGVLPAFRGDSRSRSWFAAGAFLSPQRAPDLEGQQAPRPRLSANSNRLLDGPRRGGLGGKSCLASLCYTQGPKYNADYDLSARQGADTLAFMSLLEEKLLPVLIHTFWVDTKNYVEVTRKWYAEAMPFPLNFFLPGRMQRQFMERLQLLCGEHRPENEEELEKELYQEARECLTLLSQRLGSQKFFFGDAPASLDAFVFGYLAPLLQARLPSGRLQAHLRGLHNLCAYCAHILSLYFPWDGAEVPPPRQTPAGPEAEEEPYRRRNQVLSVLAGLAAMAGYALLSGIVSIQRAAPARAPGTRSLSMADEEEDE
uniref:Metaxin-1 n=1 Tax=Felis catus TaxID=9685 RepID=A0ABI7X0B2_FELCA